MTQHKWHKEIKAWADGAEIEYCSYDIWDDWNEDIGWYEGYEYRIKPQPKEPQYLYVYDENRMGDIRFYTVKQPYETSVRYLGKIKLEVDDD
jgi:hypothetical protein